MLITGLKIKIYLIRSKNKPEILDIVLTFKFDHRSVHSSTKVKTLKKCTKRKLAML